MNHCSVLVVGGGPAGLACARALELSGQEVVVLEKGRYPIDKVCGEGLMPAGLAILAELGLEVPGQPFLGIDYHLGPLRAGSDFAEGPGRVVRRCQLSLALRQGVSRVVEGCRVLGVSRQGSGWELETTQGAWSCRWLVAADGLHSPLRQALGLQLASPRWGRRWGWRQHFQLAPWNQRVEVHLGPACEAYVSGVGPQLVGVAVLSRAGLRRDNWLSAFPELAQRLQGHPPASDLRGSGPLWQRVRRVDLPGLVLVGDAAGYLDACTGEGLSLALAQAQALAQHGFADFPRHHSRLTRHYTLVTAGALLINHWPWLRARVMARLAAHPRLLQRLLTANQGLISPLPPLAQLLLWPGGGADPVGK